MRIDVVMPQMGESIAEGTITRWIKQVGERVEQDEPIFEISTDKVDAEIPSPASGVVVEIHGKEGDTVDVNAVVAIIETDGAAEASAGTATATPTADASSGAPTVPEPAPAPAAPEPPSGTPAATPRPARTAQGRFYSPVVRKICKEHGIDPSVVTGTAVGGRVTKKDVLAFLEAGGAARAARAPGPVVSVSGGTVEAPPRAATTTQPDAPTFAPGEATARVKMSVMRKKIAEHMIESRRTSAHVHSVFEVDLTRVVQLRQKHKQSYLERHGAKLSYMAFFIKAVCDALHAWPIVNSSLEDEHVVYKKEINIGIAVALDWGLLVPVVRGSDGLSIAELSKRVADLADRARIKKLKPEEVQGGTFTITNPGNFGGLYGLPIINQPQVAILGIGGIKKRPVVIAGDAIAIRSMMYISMSYDHRVVDGAVADQFLARVQHTLENFDEALL